MKWNRKQSVKQKTILELSFLSVQLIAGLDWLGSRWPETLSESRILIKVFDELTDLIKQKKGVCTEQ